MIIQLLAIRRADKCVNFAKLLSQLRKIFTRSMKLLILVISLVLVVGAWKNKYGNDFVTYSIGERFERGEAWEL